MTVRETTSGTPSTEFVRLAGLRFDRLSEADVVKHIVTESLLAKGGWVFPVNVDVCRKLDMDLTARELVSTASLIVPDGMPLVWAARLSGQPFPERVTGASLIFSLTKAAASAERSIYLLGGAPGVPDAAGKVLASRYPGLKVAGTDSPPLGFDQSGAGLAAVRDRLLECGPDIVYIGMGFPKQEKFIAQLLPVLPSAWFIGCGAAIPFAAGTLTRAPGWMRDSGLEWLHRLVSEPQRLVGRYLIHDLPYAARLLISASASRIDRKRLCFLVIIAEFWAKFAWLFAGLPARPSGDRRGKASYENPQPGSRINWHRGTRCGDSAGCYRDFSAIRTGHCWWGRE